MAYEEMPAILRSTRRNEKADFISIGSFSRNSCKKYVCVYGYVCVCVGGWVGGCMRDTE